MFFTFADGLDKLAYFLMLAIPKQINADGTIIPFYNWNAYVSSVYFYFLLSL